MYIFSKICLVVPLEDQLRIVTKTVNGANEEAEIALGSTTTTEGGRLLETMIEEVEIHIETEIKKAIALRDDTRVEAKAVAHHGAHVHALLIMDAHQVEK
jgi:hypothetical protein